MALILDEWHVTVEVSDTTPTPTANAIVVVITTELERTISELQAVLDGQGLSATVRLDQ